MCMVKKLKDNKDYFALKAGAHEIRVIIINARV